MAAGSGSRYETNTILPRIGRIVTGLSPNKHSKSGRSFLELSFTFIFGGNVSARCFNISLREVSCVSES